MKLASKSMPGVLHNLNKGCMDWGWQGMVAYGCHDLVVVVDPRTVQIIQTLDKHKGYVVKVKWARENYHHDLASPYTLRLASADYNGKIIAWDVAQASIRAEFSDGTKPVADMEWVGSQDASRDLLAVLHPPYNMVLWNADTGTKLWKKSYAEMLNNFAFDPFNPTRLAFLGHDCIVFVDDFSVSKTPSGNGKKFYISSPGNGSNTSTGPVPNSTSGDKIDKKAQSAKTSAMKRINRILVGESSRRDDPGSPSVNDCVQLAYHRSCRHHLILVYPREISILDLEINQTVGTVPLDRTGSPFSQVLPLKQRDVLMFLHENGGLTVRVRRRAPAGSASTVPATTPGAPAGPVSSETSGSDEHHLSSSSLSNASNCNSHTMSASSAQAPTFLECMYDLRCQSDPLRVTKNNKVFGVACCPVSETRVSILLSDSRLLIWELNTVDYQPYEAGSLPMSSPLYTPGLPCPMELVGTQGTSQLQLASNAPLPKSSLGDMLSQADNFITENQIHQNKHGVLLKFTLTGLLNGIASPPLILRMCPPLTTKNWAVFQPLAALGSQTGLIQVINLSSGTLTKEFSVHSAPVRGIEWVSLHSFLSFAYANPGATAMVKNELILTDIMTGKSVPFRACREEESQIDMLKVSYLKQYFVIVFKEKPFELWDLRTGAMLRQMPKNFPHITALEWSPSHNLKSLKKKLTAEAAACLSGSQLDLSSPTATTPIRDSTSPGRDSSKSLLQNLSAREHFVFTDQDGLLYHFIVEGNMIKDGSKIPPDGGMGAITCIAWKGETLVLGDVDGNLNLWDLKNRVSRAVPTHKGWIRKIKFAPGRGNMKLLVIYNDGIDVWDAKEVEVISSARTPRDMAKVSDADWAASDRPILALHDGTVRVYDVMFRSACAPMEESQLPEAVLSPHLLPPKAALSLKCLLQHQPWNSTENGGKGYTLHMPEEDTDDPDIATAVNEQIECIDNHLKEYLPHCHFGTAQRCLYTARLFGDESEVQFWTVALHYLRGEKAEPGEKPSMPRSTSSIEPSDLFIPNSPGNSASAHSPSQEDTPRHPAMDKPPGTATAPSSATNSWGFIKDKPLDTCHDVLCDSQTFQKYQLNRIFLHDSKRCSYEHTKKCSENLMMLGETDRAVQLLLETEPDNDSYYVDSLRACLVASIRSSGASQSTIKLVATNLIASGKLSEGVQLLCLIDKGLDACRYLQTYGQWQQAAWLAKATLNYSECCEVMKRWADHLSLPQINQKSAAVLVMLSLGQFTRVIEMLYHGRNFDRAALFIEACQEFELLDKTEETGGLVECVFVEYARQLAQLGLHQATAYYCKQAAEKGKQLMQDITTVYNQHEEEKKTEELH